MDTELKEMLSTIVQLLKKIESNTSEIYWVKSEVNDVLTETEKILTHLKKEE
jgi:hypothetical protein